MLLSKKLETRPERRWKLGKPGQLEVKKLPRKNVK
jgi:hypothetical protein